MAITGLVITTAPNTAENIAKTITPQEFFTEVQASHDPDRLVAVLEVSADKVQDEIKKLQDMENILAVDIAYINYEDDIEKEGDIPCPVHISKLKHN